MKPPSRVNDILLGPLERPALRWLAGKMPSWMTSDVLTMLGVISAAFIMACYYLTNYSPHFLWLASFGFVLHWFADSLDGTLARYRNQERPRYGFFIDHTVDAISETMIAVGIGLSPYVRFDVAMLALVSYLLMSVFVLIKTHVTGVFQISFSKFGPTEVRLVIVAANTVVFFVGNPGIVTSIGWMGVYDLIGIAFTAIMLSLFLIVVLKEALRLRALDQSEHVV